MHLTQPHTSAPPRGHRQAFDFEQMSQIFLRASHWKKPGDEEGVAQPELARVNIAQFCTLLVNLAFFKENPKYVHATDKDKKSLQTAVVKCLTSFLSDTLPRLQSDNTQEMRDKLAGSEPVQDIIEAFESKTK